MRRIIFPQKDFRAETVILANGEFPRSEIALSILSSADYLVCCDGAANQLLAHGSRLPDAIVGDCDSLLQEHISRFSDILHVVPDQNTNDLTKAVNFCRARKRTKITFLGVTGKREDHTLANISLLSRYLDYRLECQMVTDYGVFNAIREDSEFESFTGQQVSLFNMSETAIISHNLKYPLNAQILRFLWEGSLNESLGDSFRLFLNDKYIVFREFVL